MNTPTFLYFIQQFEDPWFYYKIGIAADPSARLRQLQIGNPRRLELAFSLSLPSRAMAQAIEGKLHQRFAAFNMSGEWFQVLQDDVFLALEDLLIAAGPEIGAAGLQFLSNMKPRNAAA